MGKRWSWSQAHFNVYVHVFVYICLALKPEPTQTLSKKDGEVNIYLHMGIRSQDTETWAPRVAHHWWMTTVAFLMYQKFS